MGDIPAFRQLSTHRYLVRLGSPCSRLSMVSPSDTPRAPVSLSIDRKSLISSEFQALRNQVVSSICISMLGFMLIWSIVITYTPTCEPTDLLVRPGLPRTLNSISLVILVHSSGIAPVTTNGSGGEVVES